MPVLRAPGFWANGGLLPALLSPAAFLYAQGGRLRRALARTQRVAVPVICVGNLTLGGAGKTPVALALIAALAARGRAVHALTRGYGGREAGPLRVEPARHTAAEVGDEALLLARAAPTWVSRARVAGARAAVAAGAEVIVMDDGLQNPSLHQDLTLLVVDGSFGFGNGRVFPAGPLREPAADALARADAAVLVGPDATGLKPRLSAGRPLLRARLAPTPEALALKGRRVLAFAGIARPAKLFATLEALGAEPVERIGFPDHHPYVPREIEALLARAETLEALAVTTEKDAVRLPPALRARVTAVPVAIAWNDPAAPERLLALLGEKTKSGEDK